MSIIDNDQLLFQNVKINICNSSIMDLYKTTTPLKSIPLQNLPTSGKVLLLICNPYFNTSFKLGNPVCNDCKIISEKYLSHDYLSYCLFDGTADEFKKYMTFFLNQKFEDLVIYYSGHAVQMKQEPFKFDYSLSKYVAIPESELEEDGKDECLVFSQNANSDSVNIVYDNELTKLIKSNKCENILIICDCCHAGTLLDSLPNNACLLTSCQDSEKSVQIIDNGIFTYYLVKFFNLPILDLINSLKLKLSKYHQSPSVKFTSNNRKYLFYNNE